VAAILATPTILLNPGSISVYLLKTEMDKDYYVNTITYTIYSWLHKVLGIDIGLSLISLVMYILMGATIIYFLYRAHKQSKQTPELLLITVLCVLFVIVAFTRFHSPQYMMWFTPILCILVSGELFKIGLFYLTQILAFIEFPLLWSSVYTNNSYTSPLVALIFFTIEYIVWFYLLYTILKYSNNIKG
jgi:hypothetical protein